jgi:hypothetical protein
VATVQDSLTGRDDWPPADASKERRAHAVQMTTTHASDRFTTLPSAELLESTVLAPEEHGFGVDDLESARATLAK